MFPHPVIECERDGDWLLVANADGAFALEAMQGSFVELDTKGAKYVAMTSQWFAWSDGATVHFSRRERSEL